MFAKGHGTQNDFVLLPDLDAKLTLTPAVVSALCDRRRGLGADGVLRVTTAGAVLAAGVLDRVPDGVTADDWYMDYRNADGSTAQMCGNGARVFAHYLRASGLESRDEFVVGSLAGPRPVVLHCVDATNADVSVDMGKTNTVGEGQAVVGGRTFSGLAVDVGNPHLACVTELSAAELAALDVPLAFEPGERWEYGINIDWAGRMVEKVSGQDLDAYMRDHIFNPLGMRDSGFVPKDGQMARFADVHSREPDGSLAIVPPSPPPPLEFFAGEIVHFADQDRDHTLQPDMAPLPVLNRGFGGARMSHCYY